jgi:hypothetical protein
MARGIDSYRGNQTVTDRTAVHRRSVTFGYGSNDEFDLDVVG